jgi:hypothetical protein
MIVDYRDDKGRFMPGRRKGRPAKPPDEKRGTILTFAVTSFEAERAYAAARRRGTTLSSLLRSFLMRLIIKDQGIR